MVLGFTVKKTKQTFYQKLWSKVNAMPGQGPNGDCFTWTGGVFRAGQPILPRKTKGKAFRVIDVIFEGWLGEIPDNQEPVQSCGLLSCVRPEHLVLKAKEIEEIKEKKTARAWTSSSGLTITDYKVRKVKFMLNRGLDDRTVSSFCGNLPLEVIDEIACSMSKRDGARWVPFRQKKEVIS